MAKVVESRRLFLGTLKYNLERLVGMGTLSPRLSEMASVSNNLICCSHKPSTFSGNDISQAFLYTWMWYRNLFFFFRPCESQIQSVTVSYKSFMERTLD